MATIFKTRENMNMGRHKLDNPRNRNLVVRVTPDFLKQLAETVQKESDKTGTTVSYADLVRIALFKTYGLKDAN